MLLLTSPRLYPAPAAGGLKAVLPPPQPNFYPRARLISRTYGIISAYAQKLLIFMFLPLVP